METKREFGFLIQSETRHGTRYVTATLIARENGKEYPCGISSDPWDMEYALDGLGLYGHVYHWQNRDASYIGFEPEYQNVFCVDGRKAKKMGKTLDRIYARFKKDGAQLPGENFLAMARALKLSFVVERNRREPTLGSCWSDSSWLWWNIPDGKNLFVRRIAEAVDEANGKTVAA